MDKRGPEMWVFRVLVILGVEGSWVTNPDFAHFKGMCLVL
jgi:hypothetical protein